MFLSQVLFTTLTLWAASSSAAPLAHGKAESVQLDFTVDNQLETAHLKLGQCSNLDLDGPVTKINRTGNGRNVCYSWTEKDCSGDRNFPWLATTETTSPPIKVKSVKCEKLTLTDLLFSGL
ncbi:hypothetical protein BJX96DRAFT_174723 [Aspergillus floccosus]